MDRKKLLKHLVFLVFFIFIADFLARSFYWYSLIWYFDMIMHFSGGLWVGLVSLYFFPSRYFSSVNFSSTLRVLLCVLFIGVSWEVFELLVDKVVAQNPFNALDALSDVFFDLSGGAVAVLYFLKTIMPVSKNGVQ